MKLTRWFTTGTWCLCLLSILGLVALSIALPLPSELGEGSTAHSLRVEARDGSLLREVRSSDGSLSEWVNLEQCPKLLQDAVVAVEDRRFYYHPGIDPISILRATLGSISHGRIVSGASTLSMQLARTLRPHPRNLWGKFLEMALALRIEGQLSKPEILELYLNRVDFGPNLRGVAAASRGYFDKPVAALSLGESALLAGLPQSPSGYTPRRYRDRALARRAQVLARLQTEGFISVEAAAQANSESLHLPKRLPAFGAPHLVSALLSGSLDAFLSDTDAATLRAVARIRTTLDPELQQQAETAIFSILPTLLNQRVAQASLLAVDNATGNVLAYVGSLDFYDDAHQGQVDGVRAKRQPGSTLKPFVYAAAIEQLGYGAATVLPDVELTLDGGANAYRPRNFDDKFRGPVRLRESLGNSLNVPAVHTAARLGAPALLAYLHHLSFTSLNQAPEFYGPALALGDGEVTLLELVRAYMTLARGGTTIPLRFISELAAAPSTRDGTTERLRTFAPGVEARILPASVAAVITDILKDPAARLSSFGPRSPLEFEFEVAAKTGTSKGFRDNWVLGYTASVTVGVWVGNFDGSPMQKVSGITGAGPIFHAFVTAAEKAPIPKSLPLSKWDGSSVLRERYALQRVEICPLSGQRRGEHCPQSIQEYTPLDVELLTCEWHRELMLDRRNGLLAGPDCPSGETTRRKFELYPDEYAAWAKAANRPVAPTQFSANCPALATAESSTALRIKSPIDGSRFVLDPDRAPELQHLKIEALAPASAATLTLLVNDQPVGKSKRPFEFFWQLEAGSFRFVAVTDTGERSLPVEIGVRASH